MALTFQSRLLIKIHDRYVGIDSSSWDSPVKLREAEPQAEDVFVAEPVDESGPGRQEEIVAGKPFILRAFNGRFIVIDAAAGNELHAWERYRENASQFILDEDHTGCSSSADDAVILRHADGTLISCENRAGAIAVCLEAGRKVNKDSIFEIIMSGEAEVDFGMAPRGMKTGAVPAAISGGEPGEEDEWMWEDDLSADSGAHDVSVPAGVDSCVQAPEEERDDDLISLSVEEEDPEALCEVPEPVKWPAEGAAVEKLSDLHAKLHHVVERMEKEKSREETLISECSVLARRCEDLTINSDRLMTLAAQLPHLRERLAELEKELSPDGLAAERSEEEIYSHITQWSERCADFRDHFSAQLKEAVEGCIKTEQEIEELRRQLTERSEALVAAHKRYDAVREVLEAHLQANRRVESALPGSKTVSDLLSEAERILKTSDDALKEALLAIEATSRLEVIGFGGSDAK